MECNVWCGVRGCVCGISLQHVWYKPAACGSGFFFCGCGVCGVSMQCVGYVREFVLVGIEGNLLNDMCVERDK